MALLPPVGWADVATKDDLLQLGLGSTPASTPGSRVPRGARTRGSAPSTPASAASTSASRRSTALLRMDARFASSRASSTGPSASRPARSCSGSSGRCSPDVAVPRRHRPRRLSRGPRCLVDRRHAAPSAAAPARRPRRVGQAIPRPPTPCSRARRSRSGPPPRAAGARHRRRAGAIGQAVGRGQRLRLDRGWPARGAQGHHLDRVVGPGVAVAAAGARRGTRRRRPRSARGSGPGTGSRRGRRPRTSSPPPRHRRQGRPRSASSRAGGVEPRVVVGRRPRAHQVAPLRGGQQADGRQHAGPGGHDAPPACPARRPGRTRAAARRRRRPRAPVPAGRPPAPPRPRAGPAPCWRRRPPSTPSAVTPARVEGRRPPRRGRAPGRRTPPPAGCGRRRGWRRSPSGRSPPRP